MCRGKWGSESRRQWENNSHEKKSELGGIDKTEKPFQSRVAFWPREENSVGLRWDLGEPLGCLPRTGDYCGGNGESGPLSLDEPPG